MANAILISSGIYAIRNLINQKMYVGSAVNIKRRWKSHRSGLLHGKHHSVKLQRAWSKYGGSAFEWVVLEAVEKTMLIEREQHWIDLLRSQSCGYNVNPTAGSSLGRKATLETRRRMREASANMSPEARARANAGKRRGLKMPDHVKEMLRGIATGRVVSEETKKKISDSRKSFTGWTHSEETKAKIGRAGDKNSMYGRPVSEATREKITASLIGNSRAKGFKHSDETRAKVAAASTGFKHSEESKRKIYLIYIS